MSDGADVTEAPECPEKHAAFTHLNCCVEVNVLVGAIFIRSREEESRDKDEFAHETPDYQSAWRPADRGEFPVEVEDKQAHDPRNRSADEPCDSSVRTVISHGSAVLYDK